MLGVVLPVAGALGSACSSTHSPGASGTADASNPACTSRSARFAHSTRSADSTYATCAPHSAGSTDSTDSARSSDSTNSTNSTHSTHSADSTDASNTTHATDTTHAASGANEIVAVIDVDAAAAPSASVAPATAHPRTHHESETERDERRSRRVVRVVDRRIRVDRRTVDHHRVVRRNVDDLRIRLLDDDHLLATLDGLRLDLLLLIRFQSAFCRGLLAHPLHRVHDVLLLCEECVAEIRRPLNVVRQAFDEVRHGGHRLNAGVPGLLLHGICQRLVLEIGVLGEPLLQLHDLQRVGGGGKNLGQQGV